jgi:putative membrane protein
VSTPTVADHRLHPLTVLVRFFDRAGASILAIPVFFAFASDGGMFVTLMILLAMVMMVFITVLIRIFRWSRFMYGVGETDVVIEHGILTRVRRSIPFSRIQDVSIDRGPISRMIGLAKVRIETGGGAKDEGVLDSVSYEEAERLRKAIRSAKARLERGQAAAAAVAGDLEAPEDVDETDGDVIFRMSLGRVLLFGLFNFSLAYLVVFAFAAQFFTQGIGFDAEVVENWIRRSSEAAAGVASEVVAASRIILVIGMIMIAIGAIALGYLVGLVTTLLRDFGFTLTANQDRYLVSRGLLTTRQTAAAKPRIQLARIDTGPLRRRLNWFALTFQTLSDATAAEGGQLKVAPFARQAEVERVLAEQPPLDVPPPDRYEAVSRLRIYKNLVGWSFVPVTAAITIAVVLIQMNRMQWREDPAVSTMLISTLALPVLAAIALVPAFALIATFEWRKHGYGFSGDVLFVRRGAWSQRTWVIPVRNIEVVTLRRSILSRILGHATVTIDTPGASKLVTTYVADMHLADARQLLADIKARRPT